jgi:hypothetical protein
MLGASEEKHPGDCRLCAQPSAQQFCRDALAIVARLFRLWYRFRGELRDRRGNPQPIDRPHWNDADREVRNLATALFLHFEC